MPQVIIHVSTSVEEGSKAIMVKEIREAITKVLKLDTIIGQVILYDSPVTHRGTYANRDPNFVFIEVFMYPGRSLQVKQEMMERFILLINRYTGVERDNIHALIHEIPQENYFGGMMHQH